MTEDWKPTMTRDLQEQLISWMEIKAQELRDSMDKKFAEVDMLRDEARFLSEDLAAIERGVQVLRRSLGMPTPSAELQKDRFRNMSIREAAGIVIREANGQMRVTDVAKALQEGGKDLGSRAYSIVYTTLDRGEQFKKVKPGVFKLIE